MTPMRRSDQPVGCHEYYSVLGPMAERAAAESLVVRSTPGFKTFGPTLGELGRHVLFTMVYSYTMKCSHVKCRIQGGQIFPSEIQEEHGSSGP